MQEEVTAGDTAWMCVGGGENDGRVKDKAKIMGLSDRENYGAFHRGRERTL